MDELKGNEELTQIWRDIFELAKEGLKYAENGDPMMVFSARDIKQEIRQLNITWRRLEQEYLEEIKKEG